MSALVTGKPSPVFELCAETLEACLAAKPGGADRRELCVSLGVGGLTPPDELIRQAVRESGVPVHVLVRPQAETFEYSASRFEEMKHDALRAAELGAAGVVLGILRTDGTVDVEHTRELMGLLAPLPVSFHRAFDVTSDLNRALEDVVAAGCARVLTSGGAADVLAGADGLRRLQEQAAGRIDIAAGGGLRLHNARELARRWGGWQYHGSLAGAVLIDGASLLERIQMVKRELESARFDPSPASA